MLAGEPSIINTEREAVGQLTFVYGPHLALRPDFGHPCTRCIGIDLLTIYLLYTVIHTGTQFNIPKG